MAEPYYCTAEQVRTRLGVDNTVLPDDEAALLIERAEDLIDEQLGTRLVDDITGRKVVEEEVFEWQWDKLSRATVELAKFLHDNPDWEVEQRYAAPGGDVSPSTPMGSPFPLVSSLLNASNLRFLTTRATGSIGGSRGSPIGNLPEPD